MKLTPKQSTFVQRYLATLNASQAAREAGYSAQSAGRYAVELLTKPHIQAAISQAMKTHQKRLELDTEFVLRRLMNVAAFDIGEVFEDDGSLRPIRDWPGHARELVAGVKTQEIRDGDGVAVGQTRELKLPDRIRALELLGKRLKLWVDRVEHEGDVTYIVETGVPQPGDPKPRGD